jgi:formate-dependent nitrite reductase membrane component NrfD
MIEFNSTKLNPSVLPHLHVWGWEVPIYLFLGGLSAGLLIISSILILMNEDNKEKSTVKLAALGAPMVLSLGMVFLFLDLTNKINVWRFYTAFVPSSPMSWGSWLLVIFMPASLAQGLILYKDVAVKIPLFGDLVKSIEKYLPLLAKINIVMGVSVGAYTGILLSALFARPLWSNPALGFLFIMSGLSAAAACMLLVAPEEDKHLYSKFDFTFITIEVFAITIFIIGALTGSANIHDAMMYLLTGPYAMMFWTVTVAIGLVIPLLFEGLELLGKARYLPLIPILVMAGSLSLRFVIVYAGQMIPTFS